MNNKLVLGTVQFGLDYGINNSQGKPGIERVFEILDYAYKAQVRELDTADAYGNSSEILREYLRNYPNRFHVMSKFISDEKMSFKDSFLNSLERLGVSELEGYYFHRFNDCEKFKDYNAVIELKKEKKLKFLCASLYTNEDLKTAVNNPQIDLIQLPLNVFSLDAEKIALLKMAKEKKKLIYARSAFLQGLFFMDVNKLPIKLLPLRNALLELNNICNDYKISKQALCLNFIHDLEYVDKVVIGVDSTEQLKANVEELEQVIIPPIRARIEAIKINHTELLNPVNWN